MTKNRHTTDKRLLMVFVKNLVAGKVKSRLASEMGDDMALKVYKILLDHTLCITKEVTCGKAIFYSDFVESNDQWKRSGYDQYIQYGNDLGERMLNAFKFAFSKQYQKVIIVGSDCLELDSAIISEAFAAFNHHDLVIGPAKDGGYYLLGMKRLYPALFINKQWSTESVLPDTIADVTKLKASVKLLPNLSDIDEAKDLIAYDNFLKKSSSLTNSNPITI